jgi:hypothetical protein
LQVAFKPPLQLQQPQLDQPQQCWHLGLIKYISCVV